MYSTPEAMDKAVTVVEEMFSFDKSSNTNNKPYEAYEDGGELCISLSTKHILCNGSLAIDGICEDFNARNTEQAWYDDCENNAPYGVATEVWEYMESMYEAESIRSDNIYNYPTFMDTVIQFTYVSLFGMASDERKFWAEADNGHAYVLIQVHRGGDVRANYSVARLFRIEDADKLFNESYCGELVLKDGSFSLVEMSAYDGLVNEDGEQIPYDTVDESCLDKIFDMEDFTY